MTIRPLFRIIVVAHFQKCLNLGPRQHGIGSLFEASIEIVCGFSMGCDTRDRQRRRSRSAEMQAGCSGSRNHFGLEASMGSLGQFGVSFQNQISSNSFQSNLQEQLRWQFHVVERKGSSILCLCKSIFCSSSHFRFAVIFFRLIRKSEMQQNWRMFGRIKGPGLRFERHFSCFARMFLIIEASMTFEASVAKMVCILRFQRRESNDPLV